MPIRFVNSSDNSVDDKAINNEIRNTLSDPFLHPQSIPSSRIKQVILENRHDLHHPYNLRFTDHDNWMYNMAYSADDVNHKNITNSIFKEFVPHTISKHVNSISPAHPIYNYIRALKPGDTSFKVFESGHGDSHSWAHSPKDALEAILNVAYNKGHDHYHDNIEDYKRQPSIMEKIVRGLHEGGIPHIADMMEEHGLFDPKIRKLRLSINQRLRNFI